MARRVEEAIHIWAKALQGKRDDLEEEKELKIMPDIQKMRLHIRIASQTISVDPSLDKARLLLLMQFFHWHGIITSQSRVVSSQTQVNFYIICI